MSKGKSIVFAYGKFSPPTIGHEKLIQKVIDTAKHNHADARVFVSKKHDHLKSPLTFIQKIYYLKHFFGGLDVSAASDMFDTVMDLYKRGYTHVIMIAGSDRVQKYQTEISKYIKRPDAPNFDPTKHFWFDKFEVLSAGERDPDAEGAEGMSGTKMRKLAAEGDFEKFKTGVPTRDESLANQMFHDVRKGMGMTEAAEPDKEDDEEEDGEGKKKKEKKKVRHYMAAKIGAGIIAGAAAVHLLGSAANAIHNHGKIQGLRMGKLASDIKKVRTYPEIKMKYQPDPDRRKKREWGYGKWVSEEFDIDKLIESHLFGTDALKHVYQSMTPGEPGYVGMNRESSIPANTREGEPVPVQAARAEEIETGEDNSIGSDDDAKRPGPQRSSSGLGSVDSPTECTNPNAKSYSKMKESLSQNHK